MQNAPMPSLLPVYKRIDITFERGEGCWLYDKSGRRWLDFTSGIAVNGLGHAHPHLVKAIHEQATKLWHTSNLFRIEPLEKLAARLVAMSFADTVFVCNSGAEAVEGCIKLARRFHWANGRPERNRLVTFEGAFHGRTMAAISAAGGAKMVDGFGPLLDGFDHVPIDDEAALRAAITDRTAGILVEPIQGEGGIRPFTIERLRLMRSLCDEHGLLLIFDEVMTGFRVSKAGWYGLDPVAADLFTFGKVMSGGLPAAAFGGRTEVMGRLAPLGPVYQAGTLSGNPVAMAAGLATLRNADDTAYARLDANADRLAGLLTAALTEASVAHRVQRAGNMLSVFFTGEPVNDFAAAKAAETWRFPPFFHALLRAGVYPPCSAFETWFVSTALDDDAFSRIADALPAVARAAAEATP